MGAGWIEMIIAISVVTIGSKRAGALSARCRVGAVTAFKTTLISAGSAGPGHPRTARRADCRAGRAVRAWAVHRQAHNRQFGYIPLATARHTARHEVSLLPGTRQRRLASPVERRRPAPK